MLPFASSPTCMSVRTPASSPTTACPRAASTGPGPACRRLREDDRVGLGTVLLPPLRAPVVAGAVEVRGRRRCRSWSSAPSPASYRNGCGACALWTYTYTMPSGRTSATAIDGPIGACLTNGYTYVAESRLRGAREGGVARSPTFEFTVVPGSRSSVTPSAVRADGLPLPGRPAQSVHFVVRGE